MQRLAYLRSPRRDLPPMDPVRRRLVIAGLVASALLFLGGFVTAGFLWNLSRQFPQAPFKQPSRLYGAATLLAPGQGLSAADVTAELAAAGYRNAGEGPLRPGTFKKEGDKLAVHLRRFRTADGENGGAPVEISFSGRRIQGIEAAGRKATSVRLPPPLLASYYDADVEERRPVSLEELPDEVIRAVLAAEDDNFYLHPGVSLTGIARALWVNLKDGGMQQGGSTITQQVVKNVYLTSERTLTRKAKEAVIAVMLEVRYGKGAILEAYLNEIYWGKSGSANLIGLGAAAWAYFGKDASDLTLAEAATLAGMIQAPADYSPIHDPDKAKERRDWVLGRMGELEWVPQEQVARAQRQPVVADPRTVSTRPLAPYFSEAMKGEAEKRFEIDELGGEGYLLFSTLRFRDQREAEEAVEKGLAGLQGRRAKKPLQSALVSVDPRDGAVLAWVGGRDWEKSQFDRVSQAQRQAGSTFKPIVYAAAFSEGVASPVTPLKDSPINVRLGKASWRPQNYDHGFRGWVTARAALEQSLNIPTVRLALQAGLPSVTHLAREMGVESRFDSGPAVALGTVTMSPREMAQVYSTFASGGLRPEIHGLDTVLDRSGEPILGDDLGSPRRALQPQVAYLVTSILKGAVHHGTAASARGLGPLAGKTGTTNDRRDSWFAGYSPNRVTVVWVGYDDNSRTRLSGAKAALPIWARFTAAVRPAGGYPDFPVPGGIVQATIDPTTGQIATPYCPTRSLEVFAEWQAPSEPCQRHSPAYGQALADSTLGQDAVYYDPVTGEPLDPAYGAYGTEGDYGNGEPASIEIAPAGGGAFGDAEDPEAAPPQPVPIRPIQVTIPRPPDTSAPPGAPQEEGRIEIRPRREPQAPVIPPTAGVPAPKPAPGPVVPPEVRTTPAEVGEDGEDGPPPPV
ncbi:MAG TPA: PBP1A family penicillin-binding protein [Thermoanaerobaculia bacterium]|nr:PBP1A family penicillin-binding protein [Thermoanaerobaculia bacterium]